MTDLNHDGRRRKQAIAGVAGLAAILGGAALVVTGDDSPSGDAATPAPFAQPFAPAPVPADPALPSVEPTVTAAKKPAEVPVTSAATPSPKTTQELIGEAKGTAAKASANVSRPLVPHVQTIPDSEVTVTQAKVPKGDGTLKVVSARADLSGQRELSWVAGQKGEPVGDANCSRKIRLSQDEPAVERPTLLVCWRTSAAKTVYTIAVNPKGRPSQQASVAALGRAWDKL